VAVIAIIKGINLLSGYVYHRLVFLHTVANKVTGLLLFLAPLTFPFIPIEYIAVVLCSVASFAAAQEGHFIRSRKDDY